MKRAPRSTEWGALITLDEKWAFEKFNGKTQEEAQDLFKENAIYYQEALWHMNKIAFRYYIIPYINYLKTDDSKLDSDGASCFLSTIKFVATNNLEYFIGIEEVVTDAVTYISKRQHYYDAPIDIYGDFEQRAQEIPSLI